MSHAGPTVSDALWSFIQSEIAAGRPFPTHIRMREEVGEGNYANAIMDLVLKGKIIRKRNNAHRPKYTYHLPETVHV